MHRSVQFGIDTSRREPVPESTVLRTITTQVSTSSATCGDARGLDRRLRCIPHRCHSMRIGLRNCTVSLADREAVPSGLSRGLTCEAVCPRVTMRNPRHPDDARKLSSANAGPKSHAHDMPTRLVGLGQLAPDVRTLARRTPPFDAVRHGRRLGTERSRGPHGPGRVQARWCQLWVSTCSLVSRWLL